MNRLIILLAVLLAFGCRKDDLSNKKYADVGSFTVKYPKDTSVVLFQYDSIRIYPVIINQDNGTTYSYEWKVFGGTTPEITPTVISTQKDLEVPFDYNPGSYFLQFNIIDNKTGIKQINLYSVRSTARFNEGWLVASNTGDKGELSFIDMSHNVHYNLIEEYNGKTYNEKAAGVQSAVYDNAFAEGLVRILYFTNKGMRQFDANTYAEIEDVNSMFIRPMSFTSTPYYDQDAIMRNQFLVINGSVYAAYGAYEGVAEMGTFSERFEGDHEIFNSMFPTSTSARHMFYDNKKKQFLNVAFGAREFNVNTVLDKQGVVGKKMIAADYSSSTIGVYLCLMKDEADGKYYLHRFNFTSIANSATSTFSTTDFIAPASLPGIENIAAYTVSTRYLHAYYATGNAIYRIDFAGNIVTKQYEFPAGTQIADLKIYKRTNRYYQFNTVVPAHNTVMIAAINNGTAGEVHFINLDELGNLDASTGITKTTGFGRISNIAYRSPR